MLQIKVLEKTLKKVLKNMGSTKKKAWDKVTLPKKRTLKSELLKRKEIRISEKDFSGKHSKRAQGEKCSRKYSGNSSKK